MTPLLEDKNAIVYGGAAQWAAPSPVRSQARGRGSSSPAGCSTGFRVKPGIRSRTGRDLKHCTGTGQWSKSDETE